MIIAPTRNVAYKALAREKAANRELQKLSEEVKNKIKEIMENNKIDKFDCHKGVNFKQIDPNIVFLGTGSMMPSKHRNVSAIFVQYMKNHSIMFDCG